MLQQVTEREFGAIVDAVARLPDSGSVGAVYGALDIGVGRRTLQRRLAVLVAQGRLLRDGHGRGTRYRVPGGSAAPSARSPDTTACASVDHHIPLSAEGAALSRSVRAPIQTRPPVGDHREFLDDYRPGATWYLPAEVRRCPDAGVRGRPAGGLRAQPRRLAAGRVLLGL